MAKKAKETKWTTRLRFQSHLCHKDEIIQLFFFSLNNQQTRDIRKLLCGMFACQRSIKNNNLKSVISVINNVMWESDRNGKSMTVSIFGIHCQ